MVGKSTLMAEPHGDHDQVGFKNVQHKSTWKETQLEGKRTLWRNLEKEASQNEC